MTYDFRKVPTNIVTVEPAIEPVSLDEVKANVYIVDDDTDNLFITDQLIPAARKYVEKIANRSLITQTRKQCYDGSPREGFGGRLDEWQSTGRHGPVPVIFRYSPLIAVSSFTYTDYSLVVQTLSSSLYRVDTNAIPGRLEVTYGQYWPAMLAVSNSVNITYTAGYGATAASVPIIYRRAIILLASHWYNNRDQLGCVDSDMISTLENILSIEGRTEQYV